MYALPLYPTVPKAGVPTPGGKYMRGVPAHHPPCCLSGLQLEKPPYKPKQQTVLVSKFVQMIIRHNWTRQSYINNHQF